MTKYLEERNTAIDLLRAITMAMMLMVNDFWSVEGIPHWMRSTETNMHTMIGNYE